MKIIKLAIKIPLFIVIYLSMTITMLIQILIAIPLMCIILYLDKRKEDGFFDVFNEADDIIENFFNHGDP